MSLRRTAAVVGVVVAGAVAIGAPMRATEGARTTADEPHYLLTAISLWEDRDLDIGDERREGRYLEFHEVLLPIQAEVRTDGSQVAPHDPLLPALLAPATGLGGWLGAKLMLAAIAGCLAALTVAVAVRRFGVGQRLAAVVAMLTGASPPLAIYGTQVYPELPAALVALAGFWWATAPGAMRARHVVGAAAAVVALPWLSVKYAPVATVLAVGVVWRLAHARQVRHLMSVLAAFAVAGATFAALHHWWYGGWTAYASGSHFRTGELGVVGNPNHLGRSRRLVGLLVDRNFGLVPWQPAALAVVPAIAVLARRRPPGSWLLAGMVAAAWLNATFVALTMHGWWWPGRQIVVIVPLLAVAVAWWVQRLGRWGRRGVAGAGALGVFAYAGLLVGVLSRRHTLIVDFDRTVNPLVRFVGRALPDGTASLSGTTAWQTALWVAVFAVVALIAASGDERFGRRSRRHAGADVLGDDAPEIGGGNLADDRAEAVGVGERLVGLGDRHGPAPHDRVADDVADRVDELSQRS